MAKENLTLLNKDQVMKRTSLGYTAIYNLMNIGRFPKAIRLGDLHRVGWIESEVDQWVADQIKASREPVAA